uniref:Uncharacterized protein n=1 Tax=Arundo donax TaxID=35708 RepID=A0A0A8YHB7_ARUDO
MPSRPTSPTPSPLSPRDHTARCSLPSATTAASGSPRSPC